MSTIPAQRMLQKNVEKKTFQILNNELLKIYVWLHEIYLSPNIEETKFMIF